MTKQKHLDVYMRSIIESELTKGTNFKAIAAIIGKDCTTVSKEIRSHRSSFKCGAYGRAFNDCAVAFKRECDARCVCERCTHEKRPCCTCGQCTSVCLFYKKKICEKLLTAPYVCNSCSERTKCTLEKFYYYASTAQREYEANMSESRKGWDVSEAELARLDQIITPLVQKGQSLHHICITHADKLMISERTLYTYVNNGLLSARNLDMPRVVRMRPRKKKQKSIKIDTACRTGRTYADYQNYINANPDTPVIQLDSVEGSMGGSVLLTIHFVRQSLQLAFLRESNDSASVTEIFKNLYKTLGNDVFKLVFPVLLADNGSEFSNPKAIEFDSTGERIANMFYCNPSAPHQKGNCENNHEMIRRCIPKGVDIGRYSQEQITLMMSHINSYSRKALGNKSPYDVFAFQYGEQILEKLGLIKISADDITLRPELLTK